MKKLLPFIFIFTLTACGNKIIKKSPNELLLSIKDYSCKMQISYFSNKNTSTYLATQSYSSDGNYSIEFLDSENLKINFENSSLNIMSNLFKTPIKSENYLELNQNPLFLSYFINSYFNSEEPSKIKISENTIRLILPSYNNYLYSAELKFNNNLPHSLTYFDANGSAKVNIIYNEFTYI